MHPRRPSHGRGLGDKTGDLWGRPGRGMVKRGDANMMSGRPGAEPASSPKGTRCRPEVPKMGSEPQNTSAA